MASAFASDTFAGVEPPTSGHATPAVLHQQGAPAAAFKEYVIYLCRNDAWCSEMYQLLEPVRDVVHVQYVEDLSANDRKEWMRHPPVVVKRSVRKAFIGQDAFQEIENWLRSLKPPNKIQMSSATSKSLAPLDDGFGEASIDQGNTPVCGKAFASLDPNAQGLGAEIILDDRTKVNEQRMQEYMSARNRTAPHAHLRSHLNFGNQASGLIPQHHTLQGQQQQHPGQFSGARTLPSTPSARPVSVDTTGFEFSSTARRPEPMLVEQVPHFANPAQSVPFAGGAASLGAMPIVPGSLDQQQMSMLQQMYWQMLQQQQQNTAVQGQAVPSAIASGLFGATSALPMYAPSSTMGFTQAHLALPNHLTTAQTGGYPALPTNHGSALVNPSSNPPLAYLTNPR